MEKEIYLAIGAVIGAVGSFAASLLTAWNQKELSKINAQRDIERDKLKYQYEDMAKIRDRVLQGFEKAHIQLSAITHHFSLTGANLNKPSNNSVEEFDLSYAEHCSNLSNVTMLLQIYAADSELSTDGLEAAMNNYWGNYKAYLNAKPQGQVSIEQKSLENVVKYSNEILQKARSLQFEIRLLVNKLIS